MISQTALTAVRALILLAREAPVARLHSPRHVAAQLRTSPSYTSKVLSSLVKAGLLESHRGAHGGVRLARAPREITLLEIVEAAQGPLLGDYCAQVAERKLPLTCAFHQAATQLQRAMVGVLRRWTLAELAARPCPQNSLRLGRACLINLATATSQKRGQK